MTISLMLTNITNAIAAISVSGVTVKDVDEIAVNWQSTANVLYPRPDNFVTDFRLEYPTVMRGNAPVDVYYTLHYRFLGTQLGSLANFSSAYSAVVSKVVLIVNAIITNDAPYSGKVEMELGQVTFGPLTDPAGNTYHGSDIAIRIMEQQN